VRQEDFGLLFYDARSTRLTFVRSGDRLAAPPFTGEKRMLRFAQAQEGADSRPPSSAGAQVDTSLARLLDELVAKGLLVAARE
jgi:hypothetical protein